MSVAVPASDNFRNVFAVRSFGRLAAAVAVRSLYRRLVIYDRISEPSPSRTNCPANCILHKTEPSNLEWYRAAHLGPSFPSCANTFRNCVAHVGNKLLGAKCTSQFRIVFLVVALSGVLCDHANVPP